MSIGLEQFRSCIDRFSRRRRWLHNGELAYRIVSLLLAAGIVAMPLLSGYLPNPFVNLALFAAYGALAVTLAVRYFLRRGKFRSHMDEAFRMEDVAGGLNSRLISALDFLSRPRMTPLMQITADRAAKDLQADLAAALETRGRNKARLRFAVLAAVFGVIAFLPWVGLARVIENFEVSLFAVEDYLFPVHYSLTPSAGKHIFPLGKEVAVVLAFEKRPYRKVTLVQQTGAQTVRHELDVDSSGKASFDLKGQAEAEHRLHFEFGRRATAEILAVFTDRPVVENMTTELTYPVYTRMMQKTLEGVQDRLFLLPGTKVSLGFTMSKELASATLVWDDGEELALDVVGRFASTSFLHSHVRRCRLKVEDVHGLTLKEPLEIDFEVQEDEPPQVFLPNTLKDEMGLKVDELKLFGFGARVKDDYGVTRCVLKWMKSTVSNPGQITGHGEVERTLVPPKTSDIMDFSKVFESLPAQPGDRIAFKVEVYDNCVPKNQMTSSPTKVLFIYQNSLEDIQVKDLGIGGGNLRAARIAKSKQPVVTTPMVLKTVEKVRNEYQAQIESSARAPIINENFQQAVQDYFNLMSKAAQEGGGESAPAKSPSAPGAFSPSPSPAPEAPPQGGVKP